MIFFSFFVIFSVSLLQVAHEDAFSLYNLLRPNFYFFEFFEKYFFSVPLLRFGLNTQTQKKLLCTKTLDEYRKHRKNCSQLMNKKNGKCFPVFLSFLCFFFGGGIIECQKHFFSKRLLTGISEGKNSLARPLPNK